MADKQTRAEIFCGAAIKIGTAARDVHGETVSYTAFQRFLSRAVTLQGFTVFGAVGHWHDADPTKWSGNEITRVIVAYGPETKAFAAECRKIAGEYAREFSQDSVMVAFTPASFDFVDQGNR